AAPAIALKLKEKGISVSKDHVRRLMKQEGLVSKQFRPRCRGNSTYRKFNFRSNKLKRNFTQEKPNVFWVSDVTYARVDKDFYAICTYMDLFSRKIVGYGIAPENNCDLVSRTFLQAYEERGRPEGLTVHSDQGTQYTAFDFRKMLRTLKVRQSLSNPGTPHDNAVAESFFSTMKREELSHNRYESFEHLQKTVADYIVFYNSKRPHRKLNLRTPDQCEMDYENACRNNSEAGSN
ncbi:MAG: IS3 family transposase, partial [Lentisphaeria bacterium]|nr:IS3 family transposase [Lentisphaeria bacterium]